MVTGLVDVMPGRVEEGISGFAVELSDDRVDAIHADCTSLLELHGHHLFVVLQAAEYLGLEGFVSI